MIDDLVELEAPEGTYAIVITFHLENEQAVQREADRRGKEMIYLPSEMDRKHAWFRDGDSGVEKMFVSMADPR